MKYIFLFLFLPVISQAQFYAEAAFEFALLQQKETNRIIAEFNNRERHNLNDFNTFSGYRFGFGKYGKFTNMGISFGNILKKQISRNPNILRERAEVVVNTASVDALLAYRPFKSEFLSVGGALHFGQLRYRYSFGGDYRLPIVQYTVWGEIFADLAFRFRFLLSKEARKDKFYVFKFRTFYRIHQEYDLQPLQRDFNLDNSVLAGERVQPFSNLGFRLSILVPFLNETEKDFYKKGGGLEQEKLKKKMERMER